MSITITLLKNAMEKHHSDRFLIDGFPRQMDQALEFEGKVAKSDLILFFECPEKEMERRLLNRGVSSGRAGLFLLT